MFRKSTVLLSVIYLCIIHTQAAELQNALKLLTYDDSCYFEHYENPLSEAQWIEGVDISSSILDVEPSFTRLYTARSRNIREIADVKINAVYPETKYVDVFLSREGHTNNLQFMVILTPGFKYYEDYETSDVLKISVTFLCENGQNKSLEIRQKINDTNNHDPEFIPSSFYFDIPKTLNPYYFIGQITARDIDLSNSHIDFNFRSTGNNTESEFSLLGTYQNPDDPKIFHAWLITTRNISINYDRWTVIYAQDSGKPSRTKSAYVGLYVKGNPLNAVKQ